MRARGHPARKKQCKSAEEPDLLAQGAFTFGLGERADEVGERGEVDAATGKLDAGEARDDERCLHATVFTQGELLGEQGVDGFERGHLAVFETAHNGVKDLDGARHFEADHGLLDALDQRWNDLGTGAHRAPP